MSDDRVEAGDERRRRRIDEATVARGTIEGTVRDKVGAPVVAQVCGQAASDDLAAEEIREPVCVTSGADGRYRLTGLLPASYSVGAAARGFFPASYRDANRKSRFNLRPGEERHGVDIVLQPGGVEMAGVVKDVGGGPIGGALVRPEFTMGVALHAAVRVRSMADGRFRIWIAPNEFMLVAQADGYADGWAWARAPGPTVEIHLMPESMLSGRVVQVGTGVPVPGARVASGGGGDGARDLVYLLSGGGLADDQGRFRLTRLPPGRYKPVATSPRGHGQARDSVLLGLGQRVDGVVIEMHLAALVTGRVLEAGSDAPCSSGWVSLTDAKRERHFRADVRRDGRIEIEGVLAGRYRVQVLCHGFLADEQYPDLVVAAGEAPAEQRWTVRAGARIRGTVRASEGAPLANASVFAHLQAAEGNRVSPNVGHAGTDTDGHFEMTGLVRGTYAVSAVARNQAETLWPGLVTLGESGDATVDIRLDVGGDLLGEVVDEKGHPVAGVGLNAESSAEDEDEARSSMRGIRTATTADDGSFALRGLRPGTYRLFAESGRGFEARSLRSRGKGHADGAGETIEVTAGKTVRVSLVVDSQSGVIRGRVVDGRGGAITDALVDAERESGPSGAAREEMRWSGSSRPIMTDTDGRFAIEKLAPGTYTLRAHRRGGEALAEGVAVGADAELTIRPTGSIAGRVVSDGGVPDEMTIALADRQTGFSRRERFFRTAGEFALRDLPPGRWAVAVRSFDGTGDAEVELAEGQNLTGLVVRLVQRATVTGQVVSLDEGKPLPGYVVEVVPHASGGGSMTGFDGQPEERLAGPDGRFVVEEVAAGRVQVFARPPDFNEASRYGFVRRIVELQGGRTTDLGDVGVPPIRARSGEAGDLGFDLKHEAAHLESEARLIVADVRPDGPAAPSGLVVDDVIVSVDGHDVRGDYLTYSGLSSVPPGTTVTFGLARGASVRITAGSVPAPRSILFRGQ